jgi:putative endonuclease
MNYFVYILTNEHNTTLYVGVTKDLFHRITEHKQGKGSKFTQKYKLRKLVYYEGFTTVLHAIAREKQLKAGSRKKKVALIELHNPDWHDLYTSERLTPIN